MSNTDSKVVRGGVNLDTDLNNELVPIEKRIQEFERLAWGAVWVGLSSFIGGFIWIAETGGKPAEMGDFVGGIVGSFWSLAALLFVYVAFQGQQKQMLLQQQELRDTREELRAQRVEMAEQTDIYAKQSEIMMRTLVIQDMKLLEDNLSGSIARFRDADLLVLDQVYNETPVYEERFFWDSFSYYTDWESRIEHLIRTSEANYHNIKYLYSTIGQIFIFNNSNTNSGPERQIDYLNQLDDMETVLIIGLIWSRVVINKKEIWDYKKIFIYEIGYMLSNLGSKDVGFDTLVMEMKKFLGVLKQHMQEGD